jgi:hypothetical protein
MLGFVGNRAGGRVGPALGGRMTLPAAAGFRPDNPSAFSGGRKRKPEATAADSTGNVVETPDPGPGRVPPYNG